MAPKKTDPRKVVVTGMGAVTSVGATAGETFFSLVKGCSGIGPVSGFDTEGLVLRSGGQVPPPDPAAMGIPPRDVRVMGLQGLMLMKAAGDAFTSAGLNESTVDGGEIGLFAGMGMVDYGFEALLPALRVCLNRDGSVGDHAFYNRGYREIHPLWPLSMLNNMALCQTAIRLGIKGENAVFAPHADAGARALFEARAAVLEGRVRVALACGVSEKISPLSLARGLESGALNPEDGKPGVCPGEGCGVVVLESGASAKRRGAPAWARLSGFGWAFAPEAPAGCATADALKNAMVEAMADAGVSPDRVDLIMGHRDGTAGDETEMEALARVFSFTGDPARVYASKPALGNLYAASPLVDVVLAVHMMESGRVPEGGLNDPSENGFFPNGITGKSPVNKPVCMLINTRSHQGKCASLVLNGR